MLLNFSFLLPCSCLSTATRQRRINLEKWTWSLIFVNTDSSVDGMRGVDVACVHSFFFRFLMMALNIPMLWCIGSRMWVIHQMSTQACAVFNIIHTV
ncbi:hypothetical protein BGY98DRAFT_956517, partial [Russula aff. rugulosa BPL654]